MTTANMFFADKDFIQERNGQIQALAQELLKNKNVYDLAQELAEYMIRERERKDISKIAVTQDEFEQINNAIASLFRVRGVRADGEVERRGRKRKDED